MRGGDNLLLCDGWSERDAHIRNLGGLPFSICGAALYSAHVQCEVDLTRPILVEVVDVLVTGFLVIVLYYGCPDYIFPILISNQLGHRSGPH